MASQLGAVTGMKPPRESAGLNARLRYLPGIMAQKKAGEQRAEDVAFRTKQFAFDTKSQKQLQQHQKDALALENKAQRMSAGVSAANLGMGVANLQSSQGAGGGLSKSISQIPGASRLGSMFGSGGPIGSFTLGQGLSSGLAGFGASMFGGDSKLKKLGLGAGAGALMGLMGGAGGLTGGLGGAVFGGLGSLFG